jgi:hypothetical protein
MWHRVTSVQEALQKSHGRTRALRGRILALPGASHISGVTVALFHHDPWLRLLQTPDLDHAFPVRLFGVQCEVRGLTDAWVRDRVGPQRRQRVQIEALCSEVATERFSDYTEVAVCRMQSLGLFSAKDVGERLVREGYAEVRVQDMEDMCSVQQVCAQGLDSDEAIRRLGYIEGLLEREEEAQKERIGLWKGHSRLHALGPLLARSRAAMADLGRNAVEGSESVGNVFTAINNRIKRALRRGRE